MKDTINVLIVEDSEDDFLLVDRELKKLESKIKSNRVETSDQLEKALGNCEYDLVISDNSLPTLNAGEALNITRRYTEAPFLIVSGSIDESIAVNAMRSGAQDYIYKGNLKRLVPAVSRELADFEIKKKKRLAEKALWNSEHQFKLLAESICDIFFALDKDLKCVYWNGEAENALGIVAENAVGKSFENLIPDISPKTKTSIRSAFRKKSRTSLTHVCNLGGEQIYFELICYPYRDGVSVIMKDISAIKQTVLELGKANMELQNFMYRLSHDLKGPVASILGLLELAKHDVNDPKVEPYLTMLNSSTLNLQEVLNNLMDITKIKAGGSKNTEISLRKLTQNIVQNFSALIRDKNAFIRMPDQDICIFSDLLNIRSILQNLIENALKYSAETAEIVVDWKLIENDTWLSLEVKDNGNGIDPIYKDKIFDMFFRANDKNPGSGLGLYIVKNAVEVLGGSITMKNNKPNGCIFELEIPVNQCG